MMEPAGYVSSLRSGPSPPVAPCQHEPQAAGARLPVLWPGLSHRDRVTSRSHGRQHGELVAPPPPPAPVVGPA